MQSSRACAACCRRRQTCVQDSPALPPANVAVTVGFSTNTLLKSCGPILLVVAEAALAAAEGVHVGMQMANNGGVTIDPGTAGSLWSLAKQAAQLYGRKMRL